MSSETPNADDGRFYKRPEWLADVEKIELAPDGECLRARFTKFVHDSKTPSAHFDDGFQT